MMKYCFLAICLLFACITTSVGQSPAKIKKAGDNFFQMGAYQEALSSYDLVKEKYAKDVDLKYNIGVCYFYLNKMDESTTYLVFYQKNSKKPLSNTDYFLARAYHLQNKFKEASYHYKNYLKTLAADAPDRAIFKCLISQCTSGPKIQQINAGAVVSTLGDKINSPNDDFRACFNSRIPNKLFFSSNRKGVVGGKLNANNEPDEKMGKYNTDIFQSELIQGNWTEATPLSNRYNTKMSEDIVNFFDNGYQMVLLKGFSDGHKELVKENFDEDSIEVILPFAIGASSNHLDSDHFFISDSVILFSSNRPGGYGGKDLYYAIQNSQKEWESAINLGPNINGEYDEITPFLAKDGRTLYFSSNNPQSMGGFDIYKAVFQDSSRNWNYPSNVGVPINSPADDKDFILDKDGLKSFFSSNRIETFGGYDLFSGYFRSYLSEQLMGKTPKSFVDVLTNITSITDNTPNANTINKITPVEHGITTSENQIIYNLAPIYYDSKTGKVEGSRNTINTLAKLLIRQPDVIAILSSHSDNTGDAVNDLFLTIKQAEEIGKELIKNGASNKQIWIRGCGQNYPIANNQNFDGTPNTIGSTMNRRINIDVFNIAHLSANLKVNIIEPEVSSVMQNAAHNRYQNKLKGLSYKVQLTATPNLLNDAVLGEFLHPTTEKKPTDIDVLYLVGLENSFTDIKLIYDKVVQRGFPNALIIPYINGIRITEEEAQVIFNDYPDLTKYLQFYSN